MIEDHNKKYQRFFYLAEGLNLNYIQITSTESISIVFIVWSGRDFRLLSPS